MACCASARSVQLDPTRNRRLQHRGRVAGACPKDVATSELQPRRLVAERPQQHLHLRTLRQDEVDVYSGEVHSKECLKLRPQAVNDMLGLDPQSSQDLKPSCLPWLIRS